MTAATVSDVLAVMVALATLVALGYARPRLPQVLSVPLVVFTASVAAWALSEALVGNEVVLHATQIVFWWCALSVLVWLALRVSGWTHLATRRLLLLGWAPAVVTVAALAVPATRGFVVDPSGSRSDGPVLVITSTVGVLVILVALAVLLVVGSATTPAQRRLMVRVVVSFVPAAVAWLLSVAGHGQATWTPTLMSATTGVWLLVGARRPSLVQLPVTVPRVLAGIGEGVVVLTESGQVLSANAAAWELLASGLRSWTTYADVRLGPVPAPGTAVEVRTATGRRVELLVDRLDQPGRALTVVVTARDITELAEAREHLQDVASRDAMTGARNRRYLESRLPQLVEQARGRFALSVLMLDVDRFKHVNDTYGHAMGDRVIVGVADEACASLPAGAELVRMGGDEFAVVLPGMDLESARRVAARAAARCAELQFTTRSAPLSVTVSAGVYQLEPQMSADDLLAAADEALYAVKRAHRVPAAVPTPSPPPPASTPVPVVPRPAAAGSQPQVPRLPGPPAPQPPPAPRRRDRRYRGDT